MKRPTTARGQGEPRHVLRDLTPHASPNMGDSSTPKFADHGRHVLGVWKANRGRGFPWFDM